MFAQVDASEAAFEVSKANLQRQIWRYKAAVGAMLLEQPYLQAHDRGITNGGNSR